MFDTKKLIRIKTYILNFVIEAYLSQKYKNKQYLVKYLSKKLLSTK